MYTYLSEPNRSLILRKEIVYSPDLGYHFSSLLLIGSDKERKNLSLKLEIRVPAPWFELVKILVITSTEACIRQPAIVSLVVGLCQSKRLVFATPNSVTSFFGPSGLRVASRKCGVANTSRMETRYKETNLLWLYFTKIEMKFCQELG